MNNVALRGSRPSFLATVFTIGVALAAAAPTVAAQSHPIAGTWAFTVTGDALAGTLNRRIEGMEDMAGMPETRITGKRM